MASAFPCQAEYALAHLEFVDLQKDAPVGRNLQVRIRFEDLRIFSQANVGRILPKPAQREAAARHRGRPNQHSATRQSISDIM